MTWDRTLDWASVRELRGNLPTELARVTEDLPAVWRWQICPQSVPDGGATIQITLACGNGRVSWTQRAEITVDPSSIGASYGGEVACRTLAIVAFAKDVTGLVVAGSIAPLTR